MGLKCHAGLTNRALHRLSSVPLNLRCDNGNFHFLREVPHESFVFISSAFTLWGNSRTTASLSYVPFTSIYTLWGKSRTKASFSHLQLALFEGSLAPKLRFHISHFHFVREVLQERIVFTSSTITFWGKSRTKASFSHLQLSRFEGSFTGNICFHMFNYHFF